MDLLINNAGILGEITAPEDLTADLVRRVYETNLFGLVRVTHAFLPLLRKATAPSVINIVGGLGSFTLIHDPETSNRSIRSPPTAPRRARSPC
ncbi:SDR family NAD(P)-dependent oxidoreductase [Streptomyces sp. NPDC057052]|uniref:SDR family NAD(P)-dependent oxidoreductase n=1 Tax=Streptomyces sp. NPDC057052 TaxID=3346010 RepID=UPI0036362910